jgi:hypothetical protein
MSMITGARTRITLPAPPPLGGGVMSVAEVIDVTGTALMGVEGESDACTLVHTWDEWCTMTPTGRKDFDDAPGYFTGDPFAIYSGVSCDLQRLDESEARAKRMLAYTESRAVDFHVGELLSTHPDLEDLGGPFALATAVGIAEAYAATVYGGQPTLLVPRQVVPCGCAGAFKANLDGTLHTCAGSRVAPLTTHVDDLPVLDGPVTMYVVGMITLLRGPVMSVSVPQQIFDDGTFAPMRALAERIFVPIFDCLVAKVEVTC